MTRAALYFRVSTDAQAERGASLDGQRSACRTHADARDWEIVAEYQDVLSGRDPERPGYRAMLAARQSYDVILVWKFDRLGRDEADAFLTYKELAKAGREVVSVTEPSESTLVRGILTVIAAEESRRIGERVRMGMRQRVRDGYWVGPPPWGYRLVRDGDGPAELVVDEEAASLIREAAGRVEAGESLRAIAADWTRRRLPTPRGAAVWTSWIVAAVLRNPITAGYLAWRGVEGLVPGRHEPILDPGRWERLDGLIRRRALPPAGPSPDDEKLLVGLFRCECGAPMVYQRRRPGGHLYRYYTCDRTRRGNDGCPLRAVRAEIVEAVVEVALAPLLALTADELLARADRASDAARTAEQVAAERDRARLRRDIEAETRRLARQREMLQSDLMTEEEYRQDRARSLAALAAAQAALAALGAVPERPPPSAAMAERLVTIGRAWPLATAGERRQLLADLGLRATRHATGIRLDWPPDIAAYLSR